MNKLLKEWQAWASASAALLYDAQEFATGRLTQIPVDSLMFMCEAFEGHYWIGKFDYPMNSVWQDMVDEAREERVMALCMAAAILQSKGE